MIDLTDYCDGREADLEQEYKSLPPGVSLYIGGQPGSIQGERDSFQGLRMYSPVYPPSLADYRDLSQVWGMIDSGAFSDPPKKRLSPERALQRQFAFEVKASEKWGGHWQAKSFVSYDLLIDEVWIDGQRFKRRWSTGEADKAVQITIDAAQYLNSQRQTISPRGLVLAVQGVEAAQYADCTKEVLKFAQPGDIIGLGGWCILGRFTSWLPEFWRTMYKTLPLVASSGVKQVHIFGVLYEPALAGLLWIADQHGLKVSTDSSKPFRNAACLSEKENKRAGRRTRGHWRIELDWWVNNTANLRGSKYYKKPPLFHKQLGF